MTVVFEPTWVQLIQLIVSVLLPALVGIVTQSRTGSDVKAVLLVGLSIVAGILGELLNAWNAGVAFDLGSSLFAAVGTFVVAIGVHFGFWKPTGITTVLQTKVGPRHRA